MQKWLECGAVEMAAGLRRREVTAAELAEIHLTQAKRVSMTINPIAVLLEDQARAAAHHADEALAAGRGGPLCGIPVTVKDSQWLAGVPCANGSLSLSQFVPTETCEAIERLQQAGAVILGKTTCPEFCVSGTNNSEMYGATVNPWHHSRTPGGSSGGAAAALASGVGALSLGSDGGGSIRIPSAFCGLVGFKPSHGVVPRAPGFSTWESLVAYGPMARSVEDAALMFDVLAADSIQLAKPVKKGWRKQSILYSDDLGFAPVDSDVRQCFHQVIDRLSAAGFKMREQNPGLRSSVTTWATLATHDMWSHKRPGDNELESDGGLSYTDFGPYAREFIRFGSQFTNDDVAKAAASVRGVHDAYVAMFRKHRATVLITPTLGCEAFAKHRTHPKKIGDTAIELPWLDWAGYLYDANLAGFPACSIPMGLGDEGLPLGLQIIGLPGTDFNVLSMAGKIESLLDWRHRLAPDVLDQTPSVELSAPFQQSESSTHPATI